MMQTGYGRRVSLQRPWSLFLIAFFLVLLLLQSPTGEALRQNTVGRTSSAMLRGGRGLQSFDNYVYEIQRFKVDSHIIDDSEDDDANHESHPADELLQTHDADGSKSYILGGY